jgi:hypothetical protein
MNFSHFLTICFELFSFGMIFNSKIADSGPHLPDAAHRVGPARQRAIAAWLPHTGRLVRALRPHSGQRAASRAPPSPRPPHRLRRHPDRLTDRAAVPTEAARPSTPRRAAVPAPVSRPFLDRLPRVGAVPPPCAARCTGRPSWAVHTGRASAASTSRAPRGHGSCLHCATVPSTVSAQWQP